MTFAPTELLVDAPEFWTRFAGDASDARERVYAQTLSFEGDDAGLSLARLLQYLPASIDRRVVVDQYTRYIVNDTFIYAPRARKDLALQNEVRRTQDMMNDLERAGVRVKWVNPLHPLLFYRFSARNHKKILVVDQKAAYIGGVNFSDHNFAWHDLMIRFADPAIVEFLAQDLVQTCDGRNQGGRFDFGSTEFLLLDGRRSEVACARIMEVLDSARESIFIESPYYSFPFFEPLARATRRGVAVTLVAPAQNNWPLYDRYTRAEGARAGVRLLHYPGRMNHTKAILVDERELMVGSSNFDFFSYSLHQEIVCILRQPEVVADFVRRVRDPDLALCRAVANNSAEEPRPDRAAELKIRLLFNTLYALNRSLG